MSGDDLFGDMPLGRPLPVGTMFAAGCVATRAARNHRRVQQTLRPLTTAVFVGFGLPTILTVWLYEWAAKH